MKSLAGGRCFLALALACRVGAATAGDAPTAEALFRAGREASERGDDKAACERFGESYRLDPAVGTLLNIATCEEALHQLANAWESYQHVAESLPAEDDRLVLVRERIAALDARLPRLTLETEGKAPQGEILRDGVALSRGAFGVPLPIDPGEHRIVVRAPERLAREYVILLDEGERLTLRVEPGERPAPPPQRGDATLLARRESSHRFRQDAEYVLFGAGAAGLAAAGVLGALFLHASSTVHEHCPTVTTCDDTGLKAAGSADRLQLAGLVTGAVGLAALSGGVTLWILDRNDRAHPRERHAEVSVGLGTVTAQLRF